MIYLFREPLHNVGDLILARGFSRKFEGEHGSFPACIKKAKETKTWTTTGFIDECGCLLFMHNNATDYSELGVYILPKHRGKGFATRLFIRADLGGVFISKQADVSSKMTVMQEPTVSLAKKHLRWHENNIKEYKK